MAKVIIYLSIAERNGKQLLHLRDTNKTCADSSLVTEVSQGDTIIWKRDKDSGIKKISNISFEKSEDLFSKKPVKDWCMRWSGIVSKDAKGKYPYHIAYETCSSENSQKMAKSTKGDDPPPPVIKVR